MFFPWFVQTGASVLNKLFQLSSFVKLQLPILGIKASQIEQSEKPFALLFSEQIDELVSLWKKPETIYDSIVSETYLAMEHIIKALVFYILVCLCLYKLIFWSKVREFLKFLNNVRLPKRVMNNILIVTAHPDDESMFFGPLIYTLSQRRDNQIYLLCLSNGNFEKQGQVRRDELWQASKVLGIQDSNIMLINASNLPDDPNAEWKPEIVGNLILNTVERLDINSIFTFDRDGISQHLNHCSIYYAVGSLCLAKILPKACKVYTLDSVNVLRKYMSIFDILCTCIMSKYWCVLSWKQVSVIKNAMKEHKSQMKWFRWLYISFSRYMIINSFNELNLYEVELEMQLDN